MRLIEMGNFRPGTKLLPAERRKHQIDIGTQVERPNHPRVLGLVACHFFFGFGQVKGTFTFC